MSSKDLRNVPIEILVSLTAAALYGVLSGKGASVLGTLQIGSFEVAFLVALCGVMIFSRLILPLASEWWESRSLESKLDREDFKGLVEDTKKVKAHYRGPKPTDLPEGEAKLFVDEQMDPRHSPKAVGSLFLQGAW